MDIRDEASDVREPEAPGGGADVGQPAKLNPFVQEVLDALAARTHVGHVDATRVNGLH